MRKQKLFFLSLFAWSVFSISTYASPDFWKNAWPQTDFSRASVDFSEIRSGGPAKDGIPPIDRPRFLQVDNVEGLNVREALITVSLNGQVKAYPLRILMWHEIVNDTLAGVPIAVTYCPLCNAAIVFERRLPDGRLLDFGTTGKLRHSDLIMYDRQTESWWQQFGGEAVVGAFAGTELTKVSATILSWEDFAVAHPTAEVLSRETGFDRPYGGRPYGGYDELGSPTVTGSKNSSDDRVPLKERVVFVERGEEAVAVPFSALEAAGEVEVEVGGDLLRITWLPDVLSPFGSDDLDGKVVGSAEVRLAETGEIVVSDTPFWFAVAAFRPDVRVVRS